MQDKSKVITLNHPITRGDQTITAVTVRKPNSGALRGISILELIRMQTEAVMTVLPRVTEPTLIEAEVNQLDPSDLLQFGIEVAGFLLPPDKDSQEK